jgi:hypothetical protein
MGRHPSGEARFHAPIAARPVSPVGPFTVSRIGPSSVLRLMRIRADMLPSAYWSRLLNRACVSGQLGAPVAPTVGTASQPKVPGGRHIWP